MKLREIVPQQFALKINIAWTRQPASGHNDALHLNCFVLLNTIYCHTQVEPNNKRQTASFSDRSLSKRVLFQAHISKIKLFFFFVMSVICCFFCSLLARRLARCLLMQNNSNYKVFITFLSCDTSINRW